MTTSRHHQMRTLHYVWLGLALGRLALFWEAKMSIFLGSSLVHIFDLILIPLSILLFVYIRRFDKSLLGALVLFAVLGLIQCVLMFTRSSNRILEMILAYSYWLVPVIGLCVIDIQQVQEWLNKISAALIIFITGQSFILQVPFIREYLRGIGFSVLPTYGVLTRPVTTAGFPTTASYVVLALLLIYQYTAQVPRWPIQFAAYLSVFIMMTRGSLLVVAFWFLISLAGEFKKRKVRLNVVVKSWIALMVLIPIVMLVYIRSNLEQSNVSVRLEQAATAIAFFANSGDWALGGGFGVHWARFWLSKDQWSTPLKNVYDVYTFPATHNTYALLIAEVGLLGCAVLVLFGFLLLRRVPLAVSILLLLWMLFETSVLLPQYSYLAFLLLVVASHRRTFVPRRTPMIRR